MKRMEKDCAILYDLLESEKLFLSESINFEKLCSLLKVDRVEMDRYLFDELGFTGEQIVMSYKMDFKGRLKERYGIVIDR